MNRFFALFLLTLIAMYSCTQKQDCENAVDLGNVDSHVKLVRLDTKLAEAKSPKDVKELLLKYPTAAKKLFGVNPNDTMAVSDLFRFYTQEGLKEFYKNGEKINNGFQDLEKDTKSFFDHVKYYFPAYKAPEVFTVITGLPQVGQRQSIPDVILLDSVMAVGIDYFYGRKAKFRPNEYQYMLQRREPYYIVPAMALRVAQEDFVEYDANDKTMLGDMIKWGKAYYFMKRMMPCTPDSIIAGYTSEQMEIVEKSMDKIWAYFIENKLFYETSADEVHRYVGESPKIPSIGEKCPGRIGRYIGYLIVKEYMEREKSVDLNQLMKEGDAQKIFKLSKYKPKLN